MTQPESFPQRYKEKLDQAFSTSEATKAVLNDIHAELWQQLTELFAEASDEQVRQLLLQAHAQFEAVYPQLPPNHTKREHPKTVSRLRRKLAQGREAARERGAFVDWTACRLESSFDKFAESKRAFEQIFENDDDVTLVWRGDMPESQGRPADIVEFGYAYRKGSIAVLEIQIVEPIAAWVFDSNSKNKHLDQLGFVTFKESKVLYDDLKSAILAGQSQLQSVHAADVEQYYRDVRSERGEQAALDVSELAKLQQLIHDRFTI